MKKAKWLVALKWICVVLYLAMLVLVGINYGGIAVLMATGASAAAAGLVGAEESIMDCEDLEEAQDDLLED